MRLFRICIALALLLTLAAAAAPQPTAAQNQAVQPARGVPGTTFAFFAEGFRAKREIVFWAHDPQGNIYGRDEYRTFANDEGRADWTWVAPPDAMPGTWYMIARELNDEDSYAQIFFEVVPIGETGAPPPPDLDAPDTGNRDVSPRDGIPGTRFSFYATGFKPGEWVGFWFNAPDGSVDTNTNDYRARTSASSSRVDWEWNSPISAVPGIWQAVVQGEESGVQRTIFFEIRSTDAVPPTGDAELGVEPQVGEPDTTFAFFATGFEPDEQVSFWAIDPTGRVFGKDRYTIFANGQGRADWFWKAPNEDEAMPGTWEMTAFGNKSDITRIIEFELR